MWTSDLHSKLADFAAAAKDDLTIFAPYVRLEALRHVLAQVSVKHPSVITTWSTQDVLEGYSDVRIYPYLRQHGGCLFLLPRLHLKAVLVDSCRAVISTANITARGLGMTQPANIEAAVEIGSLAPTEQLWFSTHVAAAMLVQDHYYESFCHHVESQRGDFQSSPISEFCSQKFEASKHLLVSSLPMTDSPGKLLDAVATLAEGSGVRLDPVQKACMFHDCALYYLDIATSRDRNMQHLRCNFLAHPFVEAFRQFVDEGGRRYFGETKAWVQRTCADVPIPSRRDLSHHVRVLFGWMEDLSAGEYVVRRPHYSECLVHLPGNV